MNIKKRFCVDGSLLISNVLFCTGGEFHLFTRAGGNKRQKVSVAVASQETYWKSPKLCRRSNEHH